MLVANVRQEFQLIQKPRDSESDRFRFYIEAINADCPSQPSEAFDFEFIQIPQPPELTVRETCGVVELSWNNVLANYKGCATINTYQISVRDLSADSGDEPNDFSVLGDYIDARRTSYQLTGFSGRQFESGNRY